MSSWVWQEASILVTVSRWVRFVQTSINSSESSSVSFPPALLQALGHTLQSQLAALTVGATSTIYSWPCKLNNLYRLLQSILGLALLPRQISGGRPRKGA